MLFLLMVQCFLSINDDTLKWYHSIDCILERYKYLLEKILPKNTPTSHHFIIDLVRIGSEPIRGHNFSLHIY